MAVASVDLTGSSYYGNFAEMNALPGEMITRSRLIKTSAVGGAGVSTMSAGCGYKIFKIPSYYYVMRVDGITVASCSEATGGQLAIGDADYSTYWISNLSASTLGPPNLAGIKTSYGVGFSILTESQLFIGKFYSNGGEVQVGATSNEGTAQFWVVVTAVNLTPV